jgi:hypothetical protein
MLAGSRTPQNHLRPHLKIPNPLHQAFTIPSLFSPRGNDIGALVQGAAALLLGAASKPSFNWELPMNTKLFLAAAVTCLCAMTACTNTNNQKPVTQKEDAAENLDPAWRSTFNVNKANLMPTGSNPYFPVQPGKVLKMKSDTDTLILTFLKETKVIDGVTVGVLEERETKDGKLVEISYNFFATDKTTGDVYYFGEDVDMYKDGKVVSHESAWRSGVQGAKFGMQIPGKPKKGDKFYQEVAPKVALDRVEIVSTDETVKTPAGTFQHCVHFKETTPLEADVGHKYFAPGIGLIKDDEFELAEKP